MNLLIILVFSIVFFYLVCSWLQMMVNRSRINVPGPIPLSFVGNGHLFLVKSTEFMSLLHKFAVKYKDAYCVHLFSFAFVCISHPKYIEPVLSNSELVTKGRSYSILKCWLGEGLLTAPAEKWRVHRKLLAPAFHINILQNCLPVFCKNQRILNKKLKDIADGRTVDVYPILALATVDNASESVMGVSVNAQVQNESEYVHAIEDITSILTLKIQIPILRLDTLFNLLPYKTKQDRALKTLHTHSMKVIEARRAELNKANIHLHYESNDVGIKNKHAFLDLLLLLEIDGKKLDDESVREEVDTFMFGGFDTATVAISFTLFCLSKREDVQDKIIEEQKYIFGDDFDRDVTYSDLQQMKYMEMVIRESMRLYPVVPLIERLVTKDCEVGGLKLIKGTSVIMNLYESQRHPDVFEDPLEFRPERFQQPMRPFSCLPFSAGPRSCIGQKFAMLELKLMISSIVRNFVLLPSHEEPILASDITMRSRNGVKIKLLPRNKYLQN